MTITPVEISPHRSVSQEAAFSDCGLRYRIERKDGHVQEPAWWFVGGHAFHYAIEWWERQRWTMMNVDSEYVPDHAETVQVFIDAFATEMAELLLVFPNESEWHGAKHGQEGKEWWLENGAKMITTYIDQASTDEILSVDRLNFPLDPEGARMGSHQIPVLELPFMLDVDGVMVKGFIDQAFVGEYQPPYVQDLKSGSRWPGDTFQLGVYAWALEKCYGVKCEWGSYYMARKGETKKYNVRQRHPWEQLVYRFHTMDRAEKAGIYLPRVSSFCVSCGVRSICPMHVADADPFLL